MVLVQSVTVDPKICQNYDFQSPKLVHLFLKNRVISEYERFFSKIIKEYGGKCSSMREERLSYLNEYTRLLGT